MVVVGSCVEVVHHMVAGDPSLFIPVEYHPELRQRPPVVRQQGRMKINARRECEHLVMDAPRVERGHNQVRLECANLL